ncbi:UNVERIFIED_CONTAM: FH protein interacting protein FIP2 [Sesamum radiatum]|uniref:FH protein interacting protein FIP2 n=1 Tax=Sesamum radiatum TaxID=300843 RepID=A0AAW2KP36_SESRA
MNLNFNASSSVVRLNIGGKKFCTTIDTLTQREPDSMLAAMFSGRHAVHQESDKDLSFVDFSYACLKNVFFSRANLQCAKFRGRCEFTGANLRGALLAGANLQSANLQDACLVDCSFCGADLRSAHLQTADLTNANLEGANLEDNYVNGAKLTNANLKGANLQRAYLRHVNLRDTDLEGAKLDGANLLGAISYMHKNAKEFSRSVFAYQYASRTLSS